jgi:hypothetical protein
MPLTRPAAPVDLFPHCRQRLSQQPFAQAFFFAGAFFFVFFS